MTPWTRIPSPFENETDRRTICGLLTSIGLEVRVARVKMGEKPSSPIRKFVEFRQQT